MPTKNSSGRGSGSTATTNPPGNQTPNTPGINESDIARLKVDELRGRLRDRGVTGTSDLRKGDLVKALVKSLRDDAKKSTSARAGGRGATPAKKSTSSASGGGIRTGPQNSKSLKYAQEITSVDDEPERPGRSLVTTDHEVIRRWAEARKGVPVTVDGSEHDGHPGVLRIDFPANGRADRLREIGWEEWFRTFDERRLNFIYQEERSDGRQSNFFRLENPDREDG
ncbi:hypothetical protein ONA91_08985 [Micromonospora sp. DR5-3]|uniref:hypothetical protein n=1 Tax=unclassified Micromonospora TaxID=2617518 RepID=UPI0011DB4B9F|nr:MULTISPECIES: hypothetical protein [unclassified Micromonospora]MCW3814592.1 hypothetical protein [Micromonospora sp. DR5-3]TYC23285.1 hypothetical protein FXF52_16560 [Micromonospora sp. MP36]